MNSVNLIGRITKDPELRYTTGETQTAVCQFTLAVDRPGKNKTADFIRCVAFGRTAELIDDYIRKGRQMGVAGHIQTGSYDKDGQRHYTTDVIVDRMYFIGSAKQESGSAPPDPEQTAIPEGYEVIDDDDVPF